MNKRVLFLILTLALMALTSAPAALAHDGWVQSNTPQVRVGDVAYLDLMLGNHGNHHRDYKLNSTWRTSDPSFSISVHAPDGSIEDLTSSVLFLGSAGNTGYHTSSFSAGQKGAYVADARQALILTYAGSPGPHLSVKGAKTVITSVDAVVPGAGGNSKGFDRVIGQPLEIVPLTDPAHAHAGGQMTLQVLYQGQPLQDAMVSMIPRSAPPPAEMGEPYDMMTDMNGRVTFDLQAADYYLFNVHHDDPSQSSPSYLYTAYGTTLQMVVSPELPIREKRGDIFGVTGFGNWWLLAGAAIIMQSSVLAPRLWKQLRTRRNSGTL